MEEYILCSMTQRSFVLYTLVFVVVVASALLRIVLVRPTRTAVVVVVVFWSGNEKLLFSMVDRRESSSLFGRNLKDIEGVGYECVIAHDAGDFH